MNTGRVFFNLPLKLHDCGRQYVLTWRKSLERVCAACAETLIAELFSLLFFVTLEELINVLKVG